ncbi:MAG TPA: hypothetical protein VH374_19275 [Polyangia bacterium]|nr:hypothetical protein [Polyangia bacterium]
MSIAARARWFLPLALLAAAMPAPARASASSLPLDFFWDAPPECPSADVVRAQLERVVRVRRGRTPPHLTAWARVEQRGGRWFLHLRTDRDGTAGQRELEARACTPLVGAATLVLGLAFGEGVELSADPLLVDPRGAGTAVEAEQTPAPGESPAPAPAGEVPPPPPPLSSLPPAAPSPPDLARPEVIASDGGRGERALSLPPLRWALLIDGRGAWGSPPGPAFGFGLGVDAGGRRWFGSLRFGMVPRAEATAAAGIAARVTDIDGALSGCYRAGAWAASSLSACLGVQASALRVQSVGSTENSQAVAPWYAVLPALRLQVPLYRSLSAVAQVAVATSVNRPTFSITGLGDVYRVPRVAPAASVGLSVRL